MLCLPCFGLDLLNLSLHCLLLIKFDLSPPQRPTWSASCHLLVGNEQDFARTSTTTTILTTASIEIMTLTSMLLRERMRTMITR